MSTRNIKDWMTKEPVQGNHYKLWNLFPGSAFTISNTKTHSSLRVIEQRGSLTCCQTNDGNQTSLDSSIIVTAVK